MTPKPDISPHTLPGITGQIEAFILAQSPHPVPMLARVSSLALMAGICGRAFNVSGAGLNVMLIALAPSGTGKEAMKKGITKIMRRVADVTANAEASVGNVPAAHHFTFAGEFASPQALHKHVTKHPSFVHIVGEVGLALKVLSNGRAHSRRHDARSPMGRLWL